MSRERIERRFDEWQDRKQQLERQDRLERKAIEAAGGMFYALKQAVITDIHDANEVFREVPGGKCAMTDIQYGFQVSRSSEGVERVLKVTLQPRSTFIKIELSEGRDLAVPPNHITNDQIEIKPNVADGEIEYFHEQEHFKQPARAADIVSDLILPGARDFDKRANRPV